MFLIADNYSCMKLKNTFLEVADSEPAGLHRATSCPATLSFDNESDISPGCLDAIRECDIERLSDTSVLTRTPDLVNISLFTTVMLRNIPNKYSQSVLLDAVNSKGFGMDYDFFYLPVDFRNGCNMGYAFINFINHDLATNFISLFCGYRLPALRSTKVCDVSWARIQGLDANVEHYRNNPINNLADPLFRPLLFDKGHPVEFPKPDKACSRGNARRNLPNRSETKTESPQFDKIFIGGISPETDSNDLRIYFSKFGDVIESAIVRDKKSGLSRGFGFCCYDDPDAIARVLSVRQHVVLGQSVGVRRYAVKS
jgi:hypothetical protein